MSSTDNGNHPLLHSCDKNKFFIYGNDKNRSFSLELANGTKFFLEGTLHYFMENDQCVQFDNSDDSIDKLKKFLANNDFKTIQKSLEGHFIASLVDTNDNLYVFADEFGREDFFYILKNGKLAGSTEVAPLIEHCETKEYDQAAFANYLNVYGYYAPKKHTFYKEVRRLGVNEYLLIKDGEASILENTFQAVETKEYSSEDNERYYDLFRSSIETRGTKDGINWIYMSSGWDSSSVLTLLVDLYGSENVRCVIGKLKYSEKHGFNNNYEIERAKKITDYFNVNLDLIELDYCSDTYLSEYEEMKDELRSKNLYSFSAYSFFKMAKYARENGGENDVIFSGEISDGAHNLGFSQYATVLEHQDLNFREYSDKMASYVFGPSFFKLIEANNFQGDFVYNVLRERKNLPKVDLDGVSADQWKSDYINSFFLSPYRFPFAPSITSDVLTNEGKNSYLSEINDTYFKDFVDNVNEKNIYSWWLNLYSSFHWQGSTVGVTLKSPASQKLKVGCPFWDKRIINFLSEMPENWGRGLDFNRTKFPLKWMLENKVNYPSHLQTGPHSYIYDTDSNWSAEDDFLYGSAGLERNKQILSERPYKKFLNSDYFDLDKLDKLVDGFVAGEKVSGGDRSLLVRLVCLCNVGVY
jgi:asparagine synthetase B (glutamine-hydrolysing)